MIEYGGPYCLDRNVPDLSYPLSFLFFLRWIAGKNFSFLLPKLVLPLQVTQSRVARRAREAKRPCPRRLAAQPVACFFCLTKLLYTLPPALDTPMIDVLSPHCKRSDTLITPDRAHSPFHSRVCKCAHTGLFFKASP